MTPFSSLVAQAASMIPQFFQKIDEITTPNQVPFSKIVPLIGQFREMQFSCKEITQLGKDDELDAKKLLGSIARLRDRILQKPQESTLTEDEALSKLTRFEKVTDYVLFTLKNHPHFQIESPEPSTEASYFSEFGNRFLKSIYENGIETVSLRFKDSLFEYPPCSLKAFCLENANTVRFFAKTLQIETPLSEQIATSLSEAALMQLCNHKNILNLGVITEASDTEVTFVFPLLKTGSLNTISFSEKAPTQTLEIFSGILSGIAHMHSCTVVHNDIKLENLFVTSTESAQNRAEVGLLTNFAFASLTGAESNLGSADYYPPEFLLSTENPPKRYPEMDVWAIGVVLFEIVFGISTLLDYLKHEKCPKSDPDYWVRGKELFYSKYRTQEQFDTFLDVRIKELKKKTTPQLDPQLEIFLVDSIKKCLKLNPKERPSAKELATLFKEKKVTLEMAE